MIRELFFCTSYVRCLVQKPVYFFPRFTITYPIASLLHELAIWVTLSSFSLQILQTWHIDRRTTFSPTFHTFWKHIYDVCSYHNWYQCFQYPAGRNHIACFSMPNHNKFRFVFFSPAVHNKRVINYKLIFFCSGSYWKALEEWGFEWVRLSSKHLC